MINQMRAAGKLAAQILENLQPYIKPGISVEDINDLCANWMLNAGATSAALGYKGFSKQVCVSINKVVCHGAINQIVQLGDIVSVDVVLKLNGYHGDSCYSYSCGKLSDKHLLLVRSAYEAMWSAIQMVRAGVEVGDLGFQMQSYARKYGLNVLRDFTGHGIGEIMHMMPNIPFFGKPGTGAKLQAGSFITIEPMLCEGKPDIKILEDNWTAVMRDGGYAAQFEHTLAVHENGYEVLTFNKFDAANKKPKTNLINLKFDN